MTTLADTYFPAALAVNWLAFGIGTTKLPAIPIVRQDLMDAFSAVDRDAHLATNSPTQPLLSGEDPYQKIYSYSAVGEFKAWRFCSSYPLKYEEPNLDNVKAVVRNVMEIVQCATYGIPVTHERLTPSDIPASVVFALETVLKAQCVEIAQCQGTLALTNRGMTLVTIASRRYISGSVQSLAVEDRLNLWFVGGPSTLSAIFLSVPRTTLDDFSGKLPTPQEAMITWAESLNTCALVTTDWTSSDNYVEAGADTAGLVGGLAYSFTNYNVAIGNSSSTDSAVAEIVYTSPYFIDNPADKGIAISPLNLGRRFVAVKSYDLPFIPTDAQLDTSYSEVNHGDTVFVLPVDEVIAELSSVDWTPTVNLSLYYRALTTAANVAISPPLKEDIIWAKFLQEFESISEENALNLVQNAKLTSTMTVGEINTDLALSSRYCMSPGPLTGYGEDLTSVLGATGVTPHLLRIAKHLKTAGQLEWALPVFESLVVSGYKARLHVGRILDSTVMNQTLPVGQKLFNYVFRYMELP